jgi:acylphosphatase
MAMDQICRHLRIHGRVQGVWFRGAMAQEARRLGVTGWVRNRRDGTVEAVVQGNREAIDAMIAWAKKGPESAIVDRVDIADATGDYAEFRFMPTQ